METVTPLGALSRGALAGAIGTVAMDLFWYARHRAQGGGNDPLSWEFGGPNDWEKVSAPGKLGKRLAESFTQRPLPERFARLTNNVMHWGYGIAWGAAFGVVAGSLPCPPRLSGPIFGATVWGSSYVVLPLAGLYKPIWEYGRRELAPDFAAHLAYGTGTALAFRAARGWR
jgi:hypothetical protein